MQKIEPIKYKMQCPQNYNEVLIIMQGKTSKYLNFKKINKELQKNKLAVIITNSFLHKDYLIDSKNIFYIMADPIIETIWNKNWEKSKNQKKGFIKSLIRKKQLHKDGADLIKYDFKSIKNLKNRKQVNIIAKNKLTNANKINVIPFKNSIAYQLLLKIMRRWHPDGSNDKRKYFNLRFKVWPRKISPYSLLNKAFYYINYSLTTNSFYFALDFARYLTRNKIMFVGRHSDLEDCIRKSKNTYFFKYIYFWQRKCKWYECKTYNFRQVILEYLFSFDFLKFYEKLFCIKLQSLDTTLPFKEWYSNSMAKKYLKM